MLSDFLQDSRWRNKNISGLCRFRAVCFIIGGKDTVVPAVENFTWICQNSNPNFVLKWYNQIEHRIDIETFAREAEEFSKIKLLTYGI